MPYSRSLLFIYFIYSSWYWPYPFEVTFQFLFNMVGFWTYSSHAIPDKDRYSILGSSCVPWICNKERNTWGHCTYLSGSSRRQCEGTKPRAALRKSVYLFSLTPRLYCQLFWQEMCRNLPPSVILCETSWLSISILMLKWVSELDTEMAISCISILICLSGVMSDSAGWGLSPTRRPPTPLSNADRRPRLSLCSSSPPPPPPCSHVTCPGARWRRQGSQTSASNM